MTTRIEISEVVVASGTSSTSPQVSSVAFQEGRVNRIEIRVPPGPSGLMGFRLAYSGQQVIPFTSGRWIIADDEKMDWPVSRFPERGDWEIHAYNQDIYDHSIYLTFHVEDVSEAVRPVVTPVEIVETAPSEDEGP